jgi:hypothetical protein
LQSIILEGRTWEETMKFARTLTIVGFAFLGWALCAATMGIGMAVTSLGNALIIHAIAAPIFFAGVSLVYFRRWNYAAPLETALVFVAFVMAMDFLVVAMLINRSFAMFASPLGTWIPFALIFASTLLTGLFVRRTSLKLAHPKLGAPSG